MWCAWRQHPTSFFAMGEFYANFSPPSDEEVSACLQ
jgi:predicted phosphoribosyltransferase